MVVGANFLAIAARMSLVQFLGIYFVHRAGIDVTLVGLAFLCESLARGLLAPLFGALSDRIGRRALLLAAALATAVVLPCFLLVTGPASLVTARTADSARSTRPCPTSTAAASTSSRPRMRLP